MLKKSGLFGQFRFFSYLCIVKQLKIRVMAKEEVTLRDKFTRWNVYRRVGKELKESIEESVPMTTSEALKHFKASAISAIID